MVEVLTAEDAEDAEECHEGNSFFVVLCVLCGSIFSSSSSAALFATRRVRVVTAKEKGRSEIRCGEWAVQDSNL